MASVKKTKKYSSAVARDLIEGLEQFAEDLERGTASVKKYTVRRVAIQLEPGDYNPEQAKAVRELLGASQPLFAKFLGVSVKSVRSWEQGGSIGSMARRWLDEIKINPDYWRRRVVDSIRLKAAPTATKKRATTTTKARRRAKA